MRNMKEQRRMRECKTEDCLGKETMKQKRSIERERERGMRAEER